MGEKFYHIGVKLLTYQRLKHIEELIKKNNPALKNIPLTYDIIIWKLENHYEFLDSNKEPKE